MLTEIQNLTAQVVFYRYNLEETEVFYFVASYPRLRHGVIICIIHVIMITCNFNDNDYEYKKLE